MWQVLHQMMDASVACLRRVFQVKPLASFGQMPNGKHTDTWARLSMEHACRLSQFESWQARGCEWGAQGWLRMTSHDMNWHVMFPDVSRLLACKHLANILQCLRTWVLFDFHLGFTILIEAYARAGEGLMPTSSVAMASLTWFKSFLRWATTKKLPGYQVWASN